MSGLVDSFGRKVKYLRISVTDRCDFRCRYCMVEKMQFLPKAQVLTFDEIIRIADIFIELGVKKIRITGGEPLVRRDIKDFLHAICKKIKPQALEEVCLTTNASRLEIYAGEIAKAGIKRINVSLDTITPDKFAYITRKGKLENVLRGINCALEQGIKIKINIVALKNFNEDEIEKIIVWAHGKNMDVTLIEVMPIGEVETARVQQYLPLTLVRQRLEEKFTLKNIPFRTGGPARYVKITETGGILGFITPLTYNFCEGCNRVRMTCTGQLYTCLGQNDSVDLLSIIRGSNDDNQVKNAIIDAVRKKAAGHQFDIKKQSQSKRFMSTTGG